MKNAVIGLGATVLLMMVAWAIAFGGRSPCAALAVEVERATASEPPPIAKAMQDAVAGISTLQCMGLAARLKAGDKSVLRVVVVPAGSQGAR